MPQKQKMDLSLSLRESGKGEVSLTQFFEAIPSSVPVEQAKTTKTLDEEGDSGSTTLAFLSSPLHQLVSSPIAQGLDVTAALKACLTCSLCGAYFHSERSAAAQAGRRYHDPVVIETCGHCFCFTCIDVGLEHGCSILSRKEERKGGSDEKESSEDEGENSWPWADHLPGARRPGADQTAAPVLLSPPRENAKAGKEGGNPSEHTLLARTADRRVKRQRVARAGRTKKRAMQFACPLCHGPAFRWTLVRLPVMQALCDTLDKPPTTTASGVDGDAQRSGLLPGLGEYLSSLKRPPPRGYVAGEEEMGTVEVSSSSAEEGKSAVGSKETSQQLRSREASCSLLSARQQAAASHTQCSMELIPQPLPQQSSVQGERDSGTRQCGPSPRSAVLLPETRGTATSSLLSPASALTVSPAAVGVPVHRWLPMKQKTVAPDEREKSTASLTPSMSPLPRLKSTQETVLVRGMNCSKSNATGGRPPSPSMQTNLDVSDEDDSEPQQQRQRRQRSSSVKEKSVLGASQLDGGEHNDLVSRLDNRDNNSSEDEKREINGSKCNEDTSVLSLSDALSLRVPSVTSQSREGKEDATVLTPSPPQTLMMGFYRDLLYDDNES